MVSLVMVRTILLAHRRRRPGSWLPHGQQHNTARTIRALRDLDLPPPPRRESGLVHRPYLGGRTPWATPMTSDDPSPPPDWCGPESPRPWTSLYVQKEVRGRGLEHRQPHDLLVCHEGAYARLRHGPLKGRTNRKGYVCPYEEVLGCSNRSLRRRLETLPMQVHLCAHSPCNDPGAAAVHIACSASVGRTTEYDLQEMAGRGPWCRAWRVAVWASHHLPLSVRSSARVRDGWPPATVPTSTLIRRPTPIRKTSLAKPTWWHSQSPGRWSPCAKDSVRTRPGESRSPSC